MMGAQSTEKMDIWMTKEKRGDCEKYGVNYTMSPGSKPPGVTDEILAASGLVTAVK